jgi:hypothetical protein
MPHESGATTTVAAGAGYAGGGEVDTDRYPTCQRLIKRCQELFAEVENV